MMAALATFEIVISGRGCHGAMPHEGTDVVLAGCQIVCGLQSIVSRNVDPLHSAVVSVTQVNTGHAWNVMPDQCVIRGTTRWLDDQIGDLIERRIIELAEAISIALGCDAEVRYERRFPPTINDPTSAEFVRSIASAAPLNLTMMDAAPSMSSEDFAFMLRAVPGCYFWLGAAGTADRIGLHSSLYDFNDKLLPAGIALWVSIVRSSLGGK